MSSAYVLRFNLEALLDRPGYHSQQALHQLPFSQTGGRQGVDKIPSYDEIYVISDIHMGGQPGFQILKEVERLGKFINHVATTRPDERVALVLNGDVIDSLAEDINGYVATRGATQMMEGIYTEFEPVWNGFAHLVRQSGRQLIFVTGNHDIEMALPGVERSIRSHIAGDDPALNGRITFATHGAGYTCQVGGARVFCTHGNEVDDWNIVDYGALSELGNALNAGRDIHRDDWTPNAGTRLVVDVMNKIKRQYPFVDLLKPETKIVVPILLVLAPDLVKCLDFESALKIVRGKIRGSFETRGLLGAEEDDLNAVSDPEAAADLALDELLGGKLRSLVTSASGIASTDPDDMLLEAEQSLRGEDAQSDFGEDEVGTLGWFGMAIDRLRGVDKTDALRVALLDWLKDDSTFDIGRRDETFEKISARVAPEIDYIVTGHTHLERAIEAGPARYYYNCGTWIRLIRFPVGLLNDKGAFSRVFEVLKSGAMADIDNAKIGSQPLVLDRTATVRIAMDSRGTVGHLLRVKDATGKKVKLEPVDGTEFRKP